MCYELKALYSEGRVFFHVWISLTEGCNGIFIYAISKRTKKHKSQESFLFIMLSKREELLQQHRNTKQQPHQCYKRTEVNPFIIWVEIGRDI